MKEEWTEVLRVSASEVPFGVSTDGRWGFVNREHLWIEIGAERCQALVTILETDPSAFDALLRARLTDINLDPRLAESFPVPEAVRLGLTWPGGSGQWQLKALKWVEGLHQEPIFQAELFQLVSSGATQTIRHLARRLHRATQPSRS